jgi:hypothetical protein
MLLTLKVVNLSRAGWLIGPAFFISGALFPCLLDLLALAILVMYGTEYEAKYGYGYGYGHGLARPASPPC